MVQPHFTLWQLVRQSWLIHPDWDAETHVAYLVGEEFRDLSSIQGDPETVVARWLEEFDAEPVGGRSLG